MKQSINILLANTHLLLVLGEETHHGECRAILARHLGRRLSPVEETLISLRVGYGQFPALPAQEKDIWAHFWPNGNVCGLFLPERMLREKLISFMS